MPKKEKLPNEKKPPKQAKHEKQQKKRKGSVQEATGFPDFIQKGPFSALDHVQNDFTV